MRLNKKTVKYITLAIALVLIIMPLVYLAFYKNTFRFFMQNKNRSTKLYTYSDMTKDINSLATKYPDTIKPEVIGKTKYQRDIYAIKLGNGKPLSIINASHHAREWLTTSLVMKMLETYTTNYVNNTIMDGFNIHEILDTSSIYFVPMVNPDGVTLAEEGLKSFPLANRDFLKKMNNGSANFINWKANAEGIDPISQYPAGWELIDNKIIAPAPESFKGNAKASIPEVVAMMSLTKKISPSIVTAYHSSGEYIYWKYHNMPKNLLRDKKIAEKIKSLTSYEVESESAKVSNGGYKDWFIQEYKKPGFTIEVGKPRGNEPLTYEEFDQIWSKNKLVGIMLAKEALGIN